MQIQYPHFIWKNLQIQGKPPQARYGHSAILYQNYMIIFGGEHNDTSETHPIILIEQRDRFSLKPLLYELLSGELHSEQAGHRSAKTFAPLVRSKMGVTAISNK